MMQLLAPGLAFLVASSVFAEEKPKQPAEPAQAATAAPPTDPALTRKTLFQPTNTKEPFEPLAPIGPDLRKPSIDDISVRGITRIRGKLHAVITDQGGKTLWLPVGHSFRDGEITAIEETAVIFHQWDPQSPRVRRKIVKSFKREEGTK